MLPSRAATETTLALLKPDVLANPAFVDAIVRDITANRCRVTILGRKRLAWTRTQACAFYQEHRARFFYDRLVGYMTSGPFEALALRGPDAVAWWRREMGSTRPAQMRISNPECLRARYGLTDTRNSFHGSDSVESARRELAFVFGNHSFR
ncbi:hypothetical protein GGH99_003861 [Coemansia sp. RSA 1285]|nr:hypothetical protein EV177_001844 [Coemansia sp. RSA 1804]KAJ2685082.1 hypothetical protein GGH99_003861 [Coemansia sp. RSA 1285]